MPPKGRATKLTTIVLAATKGGVGKTTLAAALAARASAGGARVALIDTDPQASLARWHELRGAPANPAILDVDASSEALALVQAQGWRYLIVDTPPALIDRVEAAIYIADFVLVPVRPSALDVEAVRDVVALCKEHGKAFAFVLNQVPPIGFARLAQGARKYLEGDGPVIKAQVGMRKAYVSAMTLGKSGPEVKDAGAAEEIDALWSEVQKLAQVHHER